jgi:hypothetical protein
MQTVRVLCLIAAVLVYVVAPSSALAAKGAVLVDDDAAGCTTGSYESNLITGINIMTIWLNFPYDTPPNPIYVELYSKGKQAVANVRLEMPSETCPGSRGSKWFGYEFTGVGGTYQWTTGPTPSGTYSIKAYQGNDNLAPVIGGDSFQLQ